MCYNLLPWLQAQDADEALLSQGLKCLGFMGYGNPTGVVKPLGWLPLPNAVPLVFGAMGFTTGVGLLYFLNL